MLLTCRLREITVRAVGGGDTTGGRSTLVFAYGAKWLAGAETFGAVSNNSIVATGIRRGEEARAVFRRSVEARHGV